MKVESTTKDQIFYLVPLQESFVDLKTILLSASGRAIRSVSSVGYKNRWSICSFHAPLPNRFGEWYISLLIFLHQLM